MADRQDSPTLEQLENVLEPEEGESTADTLKSVMEEAGVDSLETQNSDVLEQPAEGEGEPEDPDKDEPAEGDEKASEAAEPDDGEQDKATDDLEPPTDWTVEEQESFRALPEDARKLVLDKAGKAKEAEQEAGEQATRLKAVEELIAPRRDAWSRNGMDEATALRQLLALSDYASQSPADFAKMFVQEHGLKAENIFGEEKAQPNGSSKAEEEEYSDPEISSLKQHITQLQEQVKDLGGTLQSKEEKERQAEQERVNREIEEFSTAKDDKGNPLRPYFEDVRGLMGPLMQSGKASDLQSAYDMACRAHPDVHAKIAAAEKHRSERERAKEQRKKAEAAGKAGASISGDPGERSAPEQTGDLREDLRRQMATQGLI